MKSKKVDNENDETTSKSGQLGSWVIPTVTTLIGVLVSITVAWYQINLSNEQALQAELERSKSVRNELVSIVEEHVINQKQLDISRVARLIDLRAKQEKLLSAPSVNEIIENAEFNILKSQYLEIDKKEQFKKIFDDIYGKTIINNNKDYNGLFKNTVNDIYFDLQNNKSKEVLPKFEKLVNEFNERIFELQKVSEIKRGSVITDVVRVINEKPSVFVLALALYGLLVFFFIVKKKIHTRLLTTEIDKFSKNIRKHTEDLKKGNTG